jgi:hypothetical protein
MALAVAAFVSSPAFADAQPAAADAPGNKAVNTTDTPQPNAPVKGANSFTEGQAKSRLEGKGFANVTDLKKDASGVWRGKAEKDGKQVNVSLDFEGNVFSN